MAKEPVMMFPGAHFLRARRWMVGGFASTRTRCSSSRVMRLYMANWHSSGDWQFTTRGNGFADFSSQELLAEELGPVVIGRVHALPGGGTTSGWQAANRRVGQDLDASV